VDVIISNCVINLSGDKDRVLQSVRVSSPVAASPYPMSVTRGEVPAEVRRSRLGGVHRRSASGRGITDKLRNAGFQSISIEPTRVYAIEDARGFSPARAST